MDRRSFLKVAGGAAVLPFAVGRLGVRWASAQEANALAGLGLPELTVTQSDTGYEVSPTTIPAGWTLITFVNKTSFGDSSADLLAIPAGMTLESITADMTAATSSPTAPPPAWLYTATFVGAPWVAAGKSAQGVALLTPGDWLALNGGAPIPPAAFTVTGDSATPAAAPPIAGAVEIGLTEYTFTGLDKPLKAGVQTWKVTNIGAQPHLMNINALPAGTTPQQYADSLMGLFSGTPAANQIPPDQMPNAGGCATLSRGQSVYLALDLPAGTYGAICFIPDMGDGMPHFMKGMVLTFTVA